MRGGAFLVNYLFEALVAALGSRTVSVIVLQKKTFAKLCCSLFAEILRLQKIGTTST